MLFTKNSPLNIINCDYCFGRGNIKYRKCPRCRGLSVGLYIRQKFLYWGDPLTLYNIRLKKGRKVLDIFRLIGALVFSLGFLVLFFFISFKDGQIQNLFSIYFWQNNYNYTKILFWLSLLGFTYLFYRLIVYKLPAREVEHHGYENKNQEGENLKDSIVLSWENIHKLKSKNKKDISATFDKETKKVLEQAFVNLSKNGGGELTPFYLFQALLSSIKISNVFIRLGIPPKSLMQATASNVVSQNSDKQKKEIVLNDDIWNILFHAYESAYTFKQDHVYVTELLVATVRQSEQIQEILFDFKIDKDKLGNAVEWLRIRERLYEQYQKFKRAAAHRNKYGLDKAMTAVATPYLNSFSEDLTMKAKYGYLSPCIAREKEIDQIFRIIEGGQQSVLLAGEHGVGKMSIIEGVAQAMVEEEVPKRLSDKRLVQISNSALLAGTTTSGAQQRLIRIMNEVNRAGNIILFIKNIHELMGLNGKEGEGGMGVAQTMVEYLGPGKFLTLATTTNDEYNRLVANSELGTVFSKVEVAEMTENQAIQVLESMVGNLEYQHNVFFSYEALEKSVKLAVRYLQDVNLPESAINLMTEAATFVKKNKGENQLVGGEDVAQIISQKTGIPAVSISENESEKLLRLEEEMHKRVVGQAEAVTLIANALRRARAEIRSQSKPISSFLFVGPTGVGKTELAKTIAAIYFGGENKMIRIDMSEYQDKSSIYRLIGEPGRQGTGILTEAVRQNPFSVILLDEMEKADPDILNLFLQVLDDGRLTDSVGRMIDFTNTIIIATSNAGTNFIQEQIKQGIVLEKIRQNIVHGELKKYYKPEFLNRFDAIVLFKPLGLAEIKEIAKIMLKRVAGDLENKGVGLKIEEAALDALANIGFDPEFGARPMRRAIQDNVENKLAELIISNKLKRRDVVVVGENLEVKVVSG